MSKVVSNSNAKNKDVNPQTGLWVKKVEHPDKSVDQRKHFKGIRKEALDKLGSTLNKLAKYDKQ